MHLLVAVKVSPLHFASLLLLLEARGWLSWHEGAKREGSDDRNAKSVLLPLPSRESLVPVTAGTAGREPERARLTLGGYFTHSPRFAQVARWDLGSSQECTTEKEKHMNK